MLLQLVGGSWVARRRRTRRWVARRRWARRQVAGLWPYRGPGGCSHGPGSSAAVGTGPGDGSDRGPEAKQPRRHLFLAAGQPDVHRTACSNPSGSSRRCLFLARCHLGSLRLRSHGVAREQRVILEETSKKNFMLLLPLKKLKFPFDNQFYFSFPFDYYR